jgi:hypothetical protein
MFGANICHDYTPESNYSNIVSPFQHMQELSHSQPALNPPSATLPPTLPQSFSLQATQPTSNICTVQPTPDPRIFVFRCTFPRCRAKTFGRWADFHRHYNGAHASEKTVFWCPVGDCNRSESRGHRGFPRKDKMMVHVEKMHRGEDDEGDVIFGQVG